MLSTPFKKQNASRNRAIIIPTTDTAIGTEVPRGVGSRGQRDFQDSGLVYFTLGSEIFKTCKKREPQLYTGCVATAEIEGVALVDTDRVWGREIQRQESERDREWQRRGERVRYGHCCV